MNNFQSITEELARKQENMDQKEEVERLKEQLNNELTTHDAKMTDTRYRMRPMHHSNIVFCNNYAESL